MHYETLLQANKIYIVGHSCSAGGSLDIPDLARSSVYFTAIYFKVLLFSLLLQQLILNVDSCRTRDVHHKNCKIAMVSYAYFQLLCNHLPSMTSYY